MYEVQMRALTIDRLSGAFALLFSLAALLLIVIGYLQPPQPPPTDEGTLAHLFQLSVVLFVPALLFVTTADRRHPRTARRSSSRASWHLRSLSSASTSASTATGTAEDARARSRPSAHRWPSRPARRRR